MRRSGPAIRQISSSSDAVSRAPVGLFGLQSRMARVRSRDERCAARRGRAPSAAGPFARAFAERPVADVGLQRPAEAAHLHVVRHHHDDLVRRLDQVHQRDELASEPPLVTWTCAGVAPGYIDGDRRAQLERAVRLRVSQRQRQQRLPVAVRCRRAPRRAADGRRSRRDSSRRCVPRSTGAAPARRSRSSCRKKCTSPPSDLRRAVGLSFRSAWIRRLTARICSFPRWRPFPQALHHGHRGRRRGRASAPRRRSRRVSDRRAAGHQRRVRALRPRDGAPSRRTCTRCRWSSRPGTASAKTSSAGRARPTSGTDGSPAARTARSSGDAGPVGRRRRLLRVAVGGDGRRSVCPPKPNGRRPPRRPARPALSLGRALRSGHGASSSRTRQTAPRTARRRAVPIRRTATASSTSPATSGNGCTIGMRPTPTRRRSARTRPGRRADICASSAAAAGCRRTSAC